MFGIILIVVPIIIIVIGRKSVDGKESGYSYDAGMAVGILATLLWFWALREMTGGPTYPG